MISYKKQFCALVLMGTCSYLSAETGQKLNLKLHKHRFNAHYTRMEKAGNKDALSAKFLAVRNGLNNGTYHYDLETAQQVLREVYRDEEMEAQTARALKVLGGRPAAQALEVEESQNQADQ